MKYSLSPQKIPRDLPLGFPSGSGYISLYIPPLATIQIQYIILNSGILKLNSSVLPSNQGHMRPCLKEYYVKTKVIALD